MMPKGWESVFRHGGIPPILIGVRDKAESPRACAEHSKGNLVGERGKKLADALSRAFGPYQSVIAA